MNMITAKEQMHAYPFERFIVIGDRSRIRSNKCS